MLPEITKCADESLTNRDDLCHKRWSSFAERGTMH